MAGRALVCRTRLVGGYTTRQTLRSGDDVCARAIVFFYFYLFFFSLVALIFTTRMRTENLAWYCYACGVCGSRVIEKIRNRGRDVQNTRARRNARLVPRRDLAVGFGLTRADTVLVYDFRNSVRKPPLSAMCARAGVCDLRAKSD